ncbi:MAG TPA: hypothetical protein VH117_13440 [Edaphobacter sp.]|nr:hypothetical protein [Edaphobacter sp.]
MSWKPRRAVLLLSFVFLLALSLRSQAHADTYKIFPFTAYNGAGPIEYLDDKGDVVIYASFLIPSPSCPPTTNTCYGVFQPFGPFYLTDTLPALNYTGIVVNYLCCASPTLTNSGYEVSYDFATRTLTGGLIGDLSTLAFTDLADRLAINNYGDIAWEDGFFDENYLAYDLTAHATPEPGPFLLLATGLATLILITIQRRGHRSTPTATN